jgi:precorrin-2 dehydrogenase / sirohydrochlorin ferrochelatase
MALYPINLNITGQLCVVVGGGAVATRKVNALLACDARIRLISPVISHELKHLADNSALEWIPRPYLSGDLQGAILVFALTNWPQVQHQVASEAKEQGIPINIADNPDASTFHTPATIRRGELLITVATGGSSPVLASDIRQELELRYGPEYGIFVELLSEIRHLTLGQGGAPEEHKALVTRILRTNVLALLKDKEWQLLHAKLCALLPPEINVSDIVNKLCNERPYNTQPSCDYKFL